LSNLNLPQQDILHAGSTVVALGDSLTYGYGANPKTAYPTVLAELSKWNVVNAGVNGDTSADVFTRANETTEQNPDLVLLGVGGNDVLQRISPDTTRANIIATIDTLQSNNIDVVLIAEPYFSTSALFGKVSDNPLYEDIVETEAIPLYSDGWSTVLSDEALKSDKIHAN
jgi:acyl-CoA thioesterase I